MDWNLVLEFIITVATIAVAIFLVPWLKEKLGTERAQQLEELIWKAVQAAEQLFGAGNGAEKRHTSWSTWKHVESTLRLWTLTSKPPCWK